MSTYGRDYKEIAISAKPAKLDSRRDTRSLHMSWIELKYRRDSRGTRVSLRRVNFNEARSEYYIICIEDNNFIVVVS